jgi:hypothetical protein
LILLKKAADILFPINKNELRISSDFTEFDIKPRFAGQGASPFEAKYWFHLLLFQEET